MAQTDEKQEMLADVPVLTRSIMFKELLLMLLSIMIAFLAYNIVLYKVSNEKNHKIERNIVEDEELAYHH